MNGGGPGNELDGSGHEWGMIKGMPCWKPPTSPIKPPPRGVPVSFSEGAASKALNRLPSFTWHNLGESSNRQVPQGVSPSAPVSPPQAVRPIIGDSPLFTKRKLRTNRQLLRNLYLQRHIRQHAPIVCVDHKGVDRKLHAGDAGFWLTGQYDRPG